jgi:D-alanyl-D-alanine dipeptidase
LRNLATHPNYTEISRWQGIQVCLKYGTTDNFTGRNLYGAFHKCYVHFLAAGKLRKAIERLRKNHSGYRFIIFDALRARSVQRELWKVVKDTPRQKYVVDPEVGSMHNYGFALDIGLLGPDGKPTDMGTPYDSFTPLSEPRLENHYLKAGQLTQLQIDNRNILRKAMVGAGFHQLPHEWWHYDALREDQVRGKFEIVESLGDEGRGLPESLRK